jgi:hypothetical protein
MKAAAIKTTNPNPFLTDSLKSLVGSLLDMPFSVPAADVSGDLISV